VRDRKAGELKRSRSELILTQQYWKDLSMRLSVFLERVVRVTVEPALAGLG
jgi:hypothetical protein